MSKFKSTTIAIYGGALALVIGLIAFALNWNVWGGGMPGYKIFLFPGNLTLVYVWHPLLTEEIDFWPKLFLHSLGQFTVASVIVWLNTVTIRKLLAIRSL
ncbi:hypothetical protein [Microbulbifer variabilis]|uniref:DUF1440 domain-containing protein n=1 Tax=Microbulbifer variabilis TaxID=266805 RepID=A0ABY4V9W9_9GAMM|nr:hypothetical protein [Microbulbifer variabilis]USD21082.1 hypothetical protein MJO52_18775 [Microbulbifer variabilis]